MDSSNDKAGPPPAYPPPSSYPQGQYPPPQQPYPQQGYPPQAYYPPQQSPGTAAGYYGPEGNQEYYQGQPQNQGQPVYVIQNPQEQKRSSGSGGLITGLLAGLACCCCLDCIF